jgi:membrane protease YdiL (CAAX protease family)
MSSVPPPGSAPRPDGPIPGPEPSRPEPQRDRDEPPWGIWTAPAAVGIGLGVGIFATIIIQAIGAAGGSSLSHPSPAVTIVSSVVFDLSFVGAALYFAVLKGHGRPADFGFRPVRLRVAVKAVVLAGVGYYTATAIWAAIFNLHGSDKLPSDFGVNHSTAALVGTAAFVCVIAPMAEEFFFRGFFFGALRKWRIVIAGREIGTWVAAVLTGILFGLAHTGSASPQYLIPLGVLGFVLCVVRWRTRSLYPCMALHSINNSLALGVNQVNWNAAEVLALMAGSVLLIAAVTWPLAARAPAVP